MEKNIYTKIANVQKKIGKMVKDQPGYNYKYFDINQLLEQLQPLLDEQGLILTQPLTNVDGRPAIKTVLVDGTDVLEETVTLPDLHDPQKVGSAVTYMRRYSIQSLFALQTADDDGASASAPKKDVTIDLDDDF